MQNTRETSIKVKIECLGQDIEEKITFFDAAAVDADGTLSFASTSTKVDFRSIPLPTIGEKLVKALIRTNISEDSKEDEEEQVKEKETAPNKKITDAILIFNDLEPWREEINNESNAALYLIKINPNAETFYQESKAQNLLEQQDRNITIFTINKITAETAKAILTRIGEDHYHKQENTNEVLQEKIIPFPQINPEMIRFTPVAANNTRIIPIQKPTITSITLTENF